MNNDLYPHNIFLYKIHWSYIGIRIKNKNIIICITLSLHLNTRLYGRYSQHDVVTKPLGGTDLKKLSNLICIIRNDKMGHMLGN